MGFSDGVGRGRGDSTQSPCPPGNGNSVRLYVCAGGPPQVSTKIRSAKNVYRMCPNARRTALLILTHVCGPPWPLARCRLQPPGGVAPARECAWRPRSFSDACPTLHNGGRTCSRALDPVMSSRKWSGCKMSCLIVALICISCLMLLSVSLHGWPPVFPL